MNTILILCPIAIILVLILLLFWGYAIFTLASDEDDYREYIVWKESGDEHDPDR